MAEKEAKVRLTLQDGGFLSGMRSVKDEVGKLGSKMANAFAGPAREGLRAFSGSLRETAHSMSGLAQTAIGLAGGFSLGTAAQQALELQKAYRDLGQQINRASDSGQDWHDVQKAIEETAKKTGQNASDLAPTFKALYSDVGDLEYTKAALEAVGTAATATGEDLSALAAPLAMAAEKFGVSASDVDDAVARIIEKTGVGGASLEGINGKFMSMAGEAAAAGMRGTEGLSTLFGLIGALDDRLGDKATWGLKTMFNELKQGSIGLKGLEKASGIKFEVDSTAFDKIRKAVGSEKGRKAMQLSLSGEARVVYDELTKPFDTAFKGAREKGSSVKQATEAGLAAYDAAMASMTSSTADYSRLVAQASERMRDDPSQIIKSAMSELQLAFTQPAMIDSLTKMARVAPQAVDGLVKIVNFAVSHPLLSLAGFVGGKAAVSGLGTFAGEAMSKAAKSGMSGLGEMIASEAAANGKWSAAGKTLGIAAAAYVGWEVGKSVANWVADLVEAKQKEVAKSETDNFNAANELLAKAKAEEKKTGAVSPETRAKLIAESERLRKKRTPVDVDAPTTMTMGPMGIPIFIPKSSVVAAEARNSMDAAQSKQNEEQLKKIDVRLSRILRVELVNPGAISSTPKPTGTNGLPNMTPARAPGYYGAG